MKPAEIIEGIAAELRRIAPEADLAGVDPAADLREALELDSMDFLNLLIALDRQFRVAIPEADYPRVATLAGLVDYLAARLGTSPGVG
jgi:acyl carrier protein